MNRTRDVTPRILVIATEGAERNEEFRAVFVDGRPNVEIRLIAHRKIVISETLEIDFGAE